MIFRLRSFAPYFGILLASVASIATSNPNPAPGGMAVDTLPGRAAAHLTPEQPNVRIPLNVSATRVPRITVTTSGVSSKPTEPWEVDVSLEAADGAPLAATVAHDGALNDPETEWGFTIDHAHARTSCSCPAVATSSTIDCTTCDLALTLVLRRVGPGTGELDVTWRAEATLDGNGSVNVTSP